MRKAKCSVMTALSYPRMETYGDETSKELEVSEGPTQELGRCFRKIVFTMSCWNFGQ